MFAAFLNIDVGCFTANKNNNYFSPEKERRKKEEKKDMLSNSQWSGGCQGFEKKYYPKRSVGVEIFLSNPEEFTN